MYAMYNMYVMELFHCCFCVQVVTFGNLIEYIVLQFIDHDLATKHTNHGEMRITNLRDL